MKKIYLTSAATVVAGIIFAVYPHWFEFMWGPQILLIPFIAGIVLVLVQDEDRVYDYLLKLLIGSTLIGYPYAIAFFIINHVVYAEYNNVSSMSFLEKFNIIDISMFALPLIIICLLGGLIGLVVRATRLVLIKK